MADLKQTRAAAEVRIVWTSTSASPVAAAELLRDEVGRWVGTPAAEVRLSHSCPHCGSSDHGRPVVLRGAARDMPFISISRAGDVVVVALCDRSPVGVDVEQVDGLRFAGFGDVALHRHETASTVEARARTWVRKESLLKATGDALHLDPRRIRLSDPDQPPQLLEWAAPNPPGSGVWMRDLDINGDAACVCVLSDTPPRVSLCQADPEELPD